jgi:hypothetical protein
LDTRSQEEAAVKVSADTISTDVGTGAIEVITGESFVACL